MVSCSYISRVYHCSYLSKRYMPAIERKKKEREREREGGGGGGTGGARRWRRDKKGK